MAYIAVKKVPSAKFNRTVKAVSGEASAAPVPANTRPASGQMFPRGK